ncbi:MAG: hypothetical protein ACK481_07510 [Candidatus Melainabacteria bacterium]|jgi:hypothetical protein
MRKTSEAGSPNKDSLIKVAINKSASSLISQEASKQKIFDLKAFQVLLFNILDSIFGLFFNLSEIVMKFTLQIFKKISELK